VVKDRLFHFRPPLWGRTLASSYVPLTAGLSTAVREEQPVFFDPDEITAEQLECNLTLGQAAQALAMCDELIPRIHALFEETGAEPPLPIGARTWAEELVSKLRWLGPAVTLLEAQQRSGAKITQAIDAKSIASAAVVGTPGVFHRDYLLAILRGEHAAHMRKQRVEKNKAFEEALRAAIVAVRGDDPISNLWKEADRISADVKQWLLNGGVQIPKQRARKSKANDAAARKRARKNPPHDPFLDRIYRKLKKFPRS